MSWIDWTIVILFLALITYTAISAQKLSKNVLDFLSAGRCAGRYLLSVAQGEAATGAITLIAAFEIFYQVGFTKFFWELLQLPVTILLAMSGWVIYRYRQTRALTMAQFFEMRYSRKFRIFSGCLIWASGILNFGIFPSVAARFFISFCGLPAHFILCGVPVSTFVVILFMLMSFSLLYIFLGGQITVLVTDFWQGVFSGVILIVVMIFLMYALKWSTIAESLMIASQPGKSMIDPFDISSQKDFNFFFYIIGMLIQIYAFRAWQGSNSCITSALTPHEAKMSGVVSQYKQWLIRSSFMMLPLVAIVLMKHPSFSHYAQTITENLQQVYPGNNTLQTQMRVPAAISRIVPAGLLGGFCVVMLGFAIGNINGYMHSWGTIFVQDVICPLLKKPLTQKQHLWCLKLSILGVAVFVILFSWLYPINEYIWMYFQITGAIYLGGAGAVIIGGLYWSRGTTAGAWIGMITGSVLSFGSLLLRQVWTDIPFLVKLHPEFPVNGQVMAFICACASVALYIVVSLLTCRGKLADMDKLLHRGQYADQSEQERVSVTADHKPIGRFWKMVGVNSTEFSKMDRLLFLGTFLYTVFEVTSFFVICGLHSLGWMNDNRWLGWWKFKLLFFFVGGAIATVGISVGGLFDLKKMFVLLRSQKADDADDGRVTGDYIKKV